MKRIVKLLFVFFILTVIPALVSAQASGTCDSGYDPGCSPDDPCPCPIDSGLVVLIAVAVALAGMQAYRMRKKQLIVKQ